MLAIGIKPTDHVYTQLMLAFAKNKDVEKVLQLHQEAIEKYGLDNPSM